VAAAGRIRRRPPGCTARRDWYRYLLNRFLLLRSQNFFTEQASHFSVVTFNFHRSFERALFLGVQAAFGLSDHIAAQMVRTIRIYHLHGTLGNPRWLNPGGTDVTDYGETNVEAVKTAVRRIKIVDEEIDKGMVSDVRHLLEKAAFVYFIGFGFDVRNLKKLSSPASMNHAVVRATAYRWTDAEQGPVTRHFGRGRIHLYPKADAIGFLREHAEALFD
jgi:hypothetical protein